MQLGELISVIAFNHETWTCPFEHDKRRLGKENVMPPVDGEEKNNATLLAKNLGNAQLSNATITVNEESRTVQYSAHHLIPGNETWPHTSLLVWIDENAPGTNVCDDIGYDVNGAANGVDLPGNAGIEDFGALLPNEQMDFARAAMTQTTPPRQFHDRHVAYSNFVINTLNAIGEKLDGFKRTGQLGCDDDKCDGKKTVNGRHYPPYRLVSRLDNVAGRLRNYLVQVPINWRRPLFTSRFALMLKENMSQAQARDLMRADRQSLVSMRK